MPQPPPAQSPAVLRFASEASKLAVGLGLKSLVIVVRDPATNEVILFSSPGGKDDLRGAIGAKLGFEDAGDAEAETFWPS